MQSSDPRDQPAALAALREAAAGFLAAELAGPFADLRGLNNHAELIDRRRAWERRLHEAGWGAIGWPQSHGGRGASVLQQVAFAEEYARAQAPSRIGHIGVELLAPTLLAYGRPDQCDSFLPPIARGEAIWAQGYSEPNAGSDLAAVRTRARLEGGRWVVDGQKIWTSMGAIADWIFVLARCTPGSVGRQGLVFLLMPMHQKGIEARPIRQATGDSEFCEVFFDGAETDEANIIGAPGEGWAIAMALLGFERGVSTLAQQMQFQNELDDIVAIARSNGRAQDRVIRQRIARAHAGLRVMRMSAMRMLDNDGDGALSPAAYTYKLFWSHWHRDLGELAMDVMGADALRGAADGHLHELVRMHLMSRADTIYAGTSQIQRNIIAERALGLPREARG